MCRAPGWPQNLSAERLGRSHGTIIRELGLNGGHYRALAAQQSANARAVATRRDFCAITAPPPLHAALRAALRRGWSPGEIACPLLRTPPAKPAMQTWHESIYLYVYVVARGARKRELVARLRRRHTERKAHPRGTLATQGKLKDTVLIDHRPREVQTRATPGLF
jgi:IS30 family transposase